LRERKSGENPGTIREDFGVSEEVQSRIRDERLFLLFGDLQNHNKVNGAAAKNLGSYSRKLADGLHERNG
jgi:hypothetical protein